MGGAKIRKGCSCSGWKEREQELQRAWRRKSSPQGNQGRDVGPWWVRDGQPLSLAKGWGTQEASKQGSCDEIFIYNGWLSLVVEWAVRGRVPGMNSSGRI